MAAKKAEKASIYFVTVDIAGAADVHEHKVKSESDKAVTLDGPCAALAGKSSIKATDPLYKEAIQGGRLRTPKGAIDVFIEERAKYLEDSKKAVTLYRNQIAAARARRKTV